MKHLIASFLLCFCLITQTTAANRYYNDNDWRSMPFVEMMVTMMKIMNNMMGGSSNNFFPGLHTLPYSPAYAPGFFPGLNNGFGGFNNLPMSPNNFPANNFAASPFSANNPANRLPESFPTGQNAKNTNTGSFWDLNAQEQEQNQSNENWAVNTASADSNNLNGIWQALSGDVLAIYNDNYFIWSDGNTRNLAGRLVIKGNMLYAYIPASKVTMQFQFYFEPGQFIVRDSTSRVYTFKRLH